MAVSKASRQTKISSFFTKATLAHDSPASMQPNEGFAITSNLELPYPVPTAEDTRSRRSTPPPPPVQRTLRSSLQTTDQLTPSSTPTRTATYASSTADLLVCPPSDMAMTDAPSSDASSSPSTQTSLPALVPYDPESLTTTHGPFTISPITSGHLASFQRLLKTLLPVAYPGRFFDDILASNSFLGRVAIWRDASSGGDEVVGGIKARLEDVDDCDDGQQDLYVQTLGVLAPYRCHGIAGVMMDAVVEEAVARGVKVRSVYAHVWQSNEDALGWYQRRGFEVDGLLETYYRRLKPAGAWLVRKQLDE